MLWSIIIGYRANQIAFPQRKAAEPGDGRLLAQQLLDLGGGVGHRSA